MENKQIELAFQKDGVKIAVGKLLPLRTLPADIRTSVKYKRIASSIREVGLIEPLIVYPQKGKDALYSVLDGTIRLDVIKALGWTDVLCLVATEEETYTYNQKINQMSPIQEHFMIMKALKAGVAEERIAATLDINVTRVREKQNLLSGICPEAVALIKDRRVSAAALREIKRVKPMRQIEMADLMIVANNSTLSYAKCLYAGTSEELKLDDQRPKDNHGVQPVETLRMQRELESVSREYKTMHESHGENLLNLVLCHAYLKKLFQNPRIARFLTQKHADIASEFQRIVDSPELDRAA